MKLEKLDFVKVVDFNREEIEEGFMEKFIGAKGIIIGINDKWDYPYDVVLFDMNLQKQSMDYSGILWRDEDLERLEGVE